MAISMVGFALAASSAKLIATEIPPGSTVIFSNPSTADTIWLGSSDTVTDANGWPIPAYGSVRLDNVSGGPVYAYTTATGGANVGVLIANLA